MHACAYSQGRVDAGTRIHTRTWIHIFLRTQSYCIYASILFVEFDGKSLVIWCLNPPLFRMGVEGARSVSRRRRTGFQPLVMRRSTWGASASIKLIDGKHVKVIVSFRQDVETNTHTYWECGECWIGICVNRLLCSLNVLLDKVIYVFK